MGTEKRERQKANRQQRLIEEARAERTAKVRRNAVRWGLAAVLGVAAVVLIAWIGGAFSGDDDGGSEAVLTLPPLDTTPPVTYPVPPKPEVQIPAESPTELTITDLVEGEGDGAAAGDTVVVHYVGVLSADGTEFDNSYDRGAPFDVVLGRGGVIQGWDEGLVGVQVGTQRQLDIPAELAYGDVERGNIPAGSALTFVIDVMDVIPAGQS